MTVLRDWQNRTEPSPSLPLSLPSLPRPVLPSVHHSIARSISSSAAFAAAAVHMCLPSSSRGQSVCRGGGRKGPGKKTVAMATGAGGGEGGGCGCAAAAAFTDGGSFFLAAAAAAAVTDGGGGEIAVPPLPLPSLRLRLRLLRLPLLFLSARTNRLLALALPCANERRGISGALNFKRKARAALHCVDDGDDDVVRHAPARMKSVVTYSVVRPSLRPSVVVLVRHSCLGRSGPAGSAESVDANGRDDFACTCTQSPSPMKSEHPSESKAPCPSAKIIRAHLSSCYFENTVFARKGRLGCVKFLSCGQNKPGCGIMQPSPHLLAEHCIQYRIDRAVSDVYLLDNDDVSIEVQI